MGDFFGGEEAPPPETRITSRLDPTQTGVENVLAEILKQGPGAAATPFGGQFTAPMTGFEGKSLAALEASALPQAQAKAGGTDAGSMAIKDLLSSGPQDFNKMFQATVADPLMQQFSQQTAPALQASLGRSAGGYGGTDRDRLVDMASNNLVSTLGRERERFAFDTEQARRNQVIAGAQTLGGLQSGGINDLLNVMTGASLPRTIEQGGLDRGYAEFARQQAAEQARLNAMLNFLGIQTNQVDTLVGQAQPGFLQGMAPGIGQGLGAASMALMFSSEALKTDAEPADTASILEKMSQMRVDKWRYHGSPEEHVGPYAEEFNALFGDGSHEHVISPIDAHGVTFAAIQELHDRIRRLEGKEAN